jgi:hypothetical protein
LFNIPFRKGLQTINPKPSVIKEENGWNLKSWGHFETHQPKADMNESIILLSPSMAGGAP